MSRDDDRDVARATRRITVAFVLSAGASIGLTILYGLGGQPQLEGLLIGVAAGGFAVGAILWGKRLMPQGPFVEEREQMASSATERDTFTIDFARDERGVKRRTFLGRLVLVALGAFGAAAIIPIRSLGPSPGRTLFRTSWRRGIRTVRSDGTPVRAEDLQVGTLLTVFPEGHEAAADSQAVLIRVDPATLTPLPGRETWSPEGYLAYSKICTHAGCPVGLYEQSTQRLFCPCHQSVFDVLNGAEPLDGPATRPLPQLPLQIGADGYVRAQSDFHEPVGPGFWNDGYH